MNNRPSHPVRQYDEPAVSVIIPVGPGHKAHVVNALDSLEAQTLRQWEVILVDDTGDNEPWTFDGVSDVLKAYPYVRMLKTYGRMGAGYARNRGVEIARASLILFLDADDNLLVPNALEKMVGGWNETGMAVYTDYVSKSCIDEQEAQRLKDNGRLLDYNSKDGLAMHLSHAADYDCERAVLQPTNPLYIWNLITTLIPKVWHDEIGGFDEKMPSWEDWEYWLRMARAGKCFARLAEPMVAYRFYTGGRRETGIQMPGELLHYISDKMEGVPAMPCSSCKQKSRRVSIPITQKVATTPTPEEKIKMADNDMVLVTYENPNRGQHKVVGSQTKINYGYRAGGGQERFYVHKSDIATHPDWFRPYQQPVAQAVHQVASTPPPKPVAVQAEPSQPIHPIAELDFIKTSPASESVGPGQVAVGVFKPADLQAIPGVTDKIAESLRKDGVKTWQDVVEYGMERLLKIEGVGPKRAEAIMTKAQQLAK
jgi:GT2 family glycosyltransferase/predicted flap endonuclease-1-like 5' DNA nuclease